MIVTKISRTYSRSINARNYGIQESWIKVEATYEGQVESGDDPKKFSEELHNAAQADVVANLDVIIGKIRSAATSLQATAAGTVVPGAAPAPTAAPSNGGSPRSL